MKSTQKIALITGSSRGIGKAIALRLAKDDIAIAVNYFEEGGGKNLADAEETKNEILAAGGNAEIFECNVSNFQKVQEMVQSVIKHFGKIDILVNNAAILRDKTLKKMSEDEWSSVLSVNLTGVFNCCRAVIEHMIENNSGRIVNISSISGQIGFFGQTNYAAAKAGVMGFTRSLAREVAFKNIRVNAISPGLVDTDMARQIPDEVRTELLKQIPMGRFAQPEEIAELAAFLVSDKSSYITGQTIHINGGWFMS